jgi:hypothetical protein
MLAGSAVAVCALVAGTLPAQAAGASQATAAARFAAAATLHQNKVLDEVMTRVAGGTRVSASEVEWDGGRIVFGVSAPASEAAANGPCNIYIDTGSNAPTGTCGYNGPDSQNVIKCQIGYFCAWDGTLEQGNCWMYVSANAAGLWFDWGLYSAVGCDDLGTWSWDNQSPFRVWKESSHSGGTALGTYMWAFGSGTAARCISPGALTPQVLDGPSRTAGWIQMTSNTAQCT